VLGSTEPTVQEVSQVRSERQLLIEQSNGSFAALFKPFEQFDLNKFGKERVESVHALQLDKVD
jgi:hypothetical protein